MRAWQAFRVGWRRSALYWQVLVALFLVNLVSGLLVAVIPAAELLGPAHYTAIREAASGIPAWMTMEIIFNPAGNINLESGSNSRVVSSALQTGVISILVALVLLPLLSWVPGSLVSGGLLLTYFESPPLSDAEGHALNQSPEPVEGTVEGSPPFDGNQGAAPLKGRETFNWRRFLWGCWHYWGAFLLFGLIQTILTLLVFVPALAILSFVIILTAWSAILLVPAFLVLLVAWTGFVELAQVYLVAGEKRRIFPALGSTLRLIGRSMGPLASYYSLSLVLLVALNLIFRLGLFPHLTLAFWPLVLILQQAFIFLRLWAHASRLAGDMEFVRSL